MAFQSGPFGYTGTIDELSAYRMRGMDRIVVRRKSRISKERIRNDDRFSNTRDLNQEWKACTMAMRAVRYAVKDIDQLGDHNYTGTLMKICKEIQLRETVHGKGERAILFSAFPFLLEGFSFNKQHTFDTVLRHPLEFAVSRETGSAMVKIPAVIPGINLLNPFKQSMFCIHIVLGAVPDILFDDSAKQFKPAGEPHTRKNSVVSPWFTTGSGAAAQEFSLTLPAWENKEGYSLVLTAGIRFGQPFNPETVNDTKYANAFKILKVV